MLVDEYGIFPQPRDTALENQLHELKAILDENLAVQERTIGVLHETQLVGLLVIVAIAGNIAYNWATRRKVRAALEKMKELSQALGK